MHAERLVRSSEQGCTVGMNNEERVFDQGVGSSMTPRAPTLAVKHSISTQEERMKEEKKMLPDPIVINAQTACMIRPVVNAINRLQAFLSTPRHFLDSFGA